MNLSAFSHPAGNALPIEAKASLIFVSTPNLGPTRESQVHLCETQQQLFCDSFSELHFAHL